MHPTLQCGFRGAWMAMTLALLGVLLQIKQIVRDGVYVKTKNVQRDPHLYNNLRLMRPYFQVNSWSLDRKFITFVKELDGLVGTVLSKGPSESARAIKDTPGDYLQALLAPLSQPKSGRQVPAQLLSAVKTQVEDLLTYSRAHNLVIPIR